MRKITKLSLALWRRLTGRQLTIERRGPARHMSARLPAETLARIGGK